MKKRGFTLAEVLITLGIVGVVAALTAPALVMSSRNEANAARLSTVVSNMENAFQSAIAQEGVDNLYGTSLWDFGGGDSLGANDAGIPRFVGRLGQYMIVNGYKNNQADFYGNGVQVYAMSDTGGVGRATTVTGTPFAIETKNGAAIFMQCMRNNNLAANKPGAIAAGCSLYTDAAAVAIDVNGKNGPNVFGRDIFFFILGENGILYPRGSNDTNYFLRSRGDGRWSERGVVSSCRDDDKGREATQKGTGCTARVIAEGYKINY